MHVWRTRKTQSEYQTSIKKFLDPNKEPIKRLKSLKHGLEKSSAQEVKEFYREHHVVVFYVVYSSFTTLETTIQDKLHKGKGYSDVLMKDLQDLVLPQFRQVLIFLPELVHQKWQFNSICLILRKLLHPGNHMKLRQYGVQLLVLWVEALQENAGDACMELFASVIPHFPPKKTPMGLPIASSVAASTLGPSPGIGDRYGIYTYSNPRHHLASWAGDRSQLRRSSSAILLGKNERRSPSAREMVCPNNLIPLIPAASEEPDSQAVTEALMECLLESLTELTHWLHWDDPKQYLRGFAHLFFLFKLFYLACLYKDVRTDAGLYTPPPTPVTDFSSSSDGAPSNSEKLDSVMEEPSREGVVLVPVSNSAPDASPQQYKRKRSDPYRMSVVIKLEYNLSNPIYARVKNLILTFVLYWFLPNSEPPEKGVVPGSTPPPPPILPSEEVSTQSGMELMRAMWFTTPDNISLLLEICRQGFTSLTNPSHRKQLLELYRHWNQVPEKPVFMAASPPLSPVQSSGEPSPSTHVNIAASSHPSSGVLSWEQLSNYEGFRLAKVEAGMAASLRMIIAHTQQVFLLKTREDLTLQGELCRKVIRIYQDIAVSWLLDKASWEYLLAVLLHHTWKLLTHKDTTLGCGLANPLLKTLLVCFLRASVATEVNPELWDHLLHVLQSLTHWKEVVVQWKFAMESMTGVLAQAVYRLDLSELPLDNLSSEPHRKRVASVGRPRKSGVSQQEIAPLRLSSFSDIYAGPPAYIHKRSHQRPSTPPSESAGGDQVDSDSSVKKKSTLTRSATQQEPASPLTGACALKRYSTPSGPTLPRPSILSTISEGRSSLKLLEESGRHSGGEDQQSNSTTDPRQSLSPTSPPPFEEEEEEVYLIPKPSKVKESSVSVIANLNTKSPSPGPDAVDSHPPIKEQGGEAVRKNGDGIKKLFSGGLFKLHSSPDTRHRKKFSPDDVVLTNQNSLELEEIGKTKNKKASRFHKRSGSDVTDGVAAKKKSPQVSKKLKEGDADSAKSLEKKQARCYIRKSSSEGNLNRLLLIQSDHTLPDYDSDSITEESGVQMASTTDTLNRSSSFSPSQTYDEDPIPQRNGPSPSSSSSTHRPLRRSLTVDSPDPSIEYEGKEGSPIPPASLSPINGHGSDGWSAERAAVVWLRMLKILGNVNQIKDPSIHAVAITGLHDIWKALSNIRANSGISLNSHTTPPLPHFMPPLDLLLPWVVETCSLPPPYNEGRETAYQLLCDMTIVHWHTPPSHQHLTHFYRLLHLALQPTHAMCAVAIKHGCQLFSHGLAGSSVLLLDCVSACRALLSYHTSAAPHNEALYLLGSLLFLPDLYSSFPLPSPASTEETTPPNAAGVEATPPKGGEIKEQIVDILFQAAVTETSRIARCIALYQVGTLVFSELYSNRPSRRLPEGVDILLASLHFADRNIVMCAIDMMTLLSEVGPQILQLYPSMPCRILLSICFAIAVFLTEELERASWVDKVLVTLLLLLRDWLMVLPLKSLTQDATITQDTIRTIFEVLQAAAGSMERVSAKRHALSQLFTIHSPVNVDMEQLETSSNRTPQPPSQGGSSTNRSFGRRKDVQLSLERLQSSSSMQSEDGRIQTAARSVLTHLLNLLGHFPFGCGAAQMSSTIKEHHDSPSFFHLDDLSSEVFDSPRIQFFALNQTAVVTLAEIPTMLDGVPGEVSTGPFQTRVIVRDVTGKYTWDCTLLYGPDSLLQESCSLAGADSLDSLVESVGGASETPLPVESWNSGSSDPLQPPSWRTHANSDRDVLQDLLEHVEHTSPECIGQDQVGLSQAPPITGKGEEEAYVQVALLSLLHEQECSERSYGHEALSHPSMRGERALAPRHFPYTVAFHHCSIFLSHLGLLSWDKRDHLNLLDKTNQLILELKNLDLLQAQSRATYKVAVLYVGPGQGDKESILNNKSGSKSYEDFVAGLGWEVNMKTHAGYMAGMQKEFASCSMPYYATSSEEVLFHVATRMSSMSLRIEQKVRHLGNDEVHIVWSEHWRDYRRSIFRTQFADVLIVLYPLPTGLIRVQINKKPIVPQFGPLFDGAMVDRETLAPLVRATAINALRAQRNPLIGYRGRYEERLKYIQSITSDRLLSTYEEFCQNVMHPLEMTTSPSAPLTNSTTTLRASPQKQTPNISLTNLLRSSALHPNYSSSSSSSFKHLQQRRSPNSPTIALDKSHRFIPSISNESPLVARRPRARTDDRLLQSDDHSQAVQSSLLNRNISVPENLNELSLSPGRSHTSPGDSTGQSGLVSGLVGRRVPSPSPRSHT